MSLVTLEEAKRALKIREDNDTDDDQLTSMVAGIAGVVEDYKNEVIEVRDITEELTLLGSNTFLLHHAPVISLVSVATLNNATTWDVSNLHVSTIGRVRVLSGPRVAGVVEVTYSAGYEEVPDRYKRGALIILQHVWETQRGPGGVNGGVVGSEEGRNLHYGWTIPRKALEWLGSPGVAVA